MKKKYYEDLKNERETAPIINRVRRYFFPGLALVLSLILIWQNFYFTNCRNGNVVEAGRYPLLNPSREVIGEENIIVDFQDLRESLTKKYEKKDNFLISIYFEYLPTGANISINKDEEMWPASLIKIPVGMAAMKKVEEGQWKMSNELVILEDDKDSSFGTLYQKPSGTKMTVEETLRQSLVFSDNTAHFVLLRNLEASEIEEFYIHLGFDDFIETLKRSPEAATFDNRITAKRYSTFFRSLYNASYLSSEYSEKFLDLLRENSNHEYLDQVIPEEVPFPHKTGIRDEDGLIADSGIVYIPGRPYIITVMIQKDDKKVTDEATQIMKDISEEIYQYVAENNK